MKVLTRITEDELRRPWTEQEQRRYVGILVRSGDRVLGRQRMNESGPKGRMSERQAREFFGKHYDNVMAEVSVRDTLHGIADRMESGELPNGLEDRLNLLAMAEEAFSGPKKILPNEDLNFDAMR